MKIVGIGGGTGLPVLLRGLKQLAANTTREMEDEIDTTAVVCVSDTGGSSGILRRKFGIPAVGDLRNCLVALAEASSPLTDLFQVRLAADAPLGGHPLGNLIVTALFARSGNLREALAASAKLLQSRGEVLASTERETTLCAEFNDGSVARGESEIAARRAGIRRVWMEPERPPSGFGVVEKLLQADAIVIGPGSLFTSIVPNLLPVGVAEAIERSAALKIVVSNLMTEPGETVGFTAADHLQVLNRYTRFGPAPICLLNSRPIPQLAVRRYARAGSEPVPGDARGIASQGAVPVSVDLLDEQATEIRHDPLKLAHLVVALTRGVMRVRDLGTPEMD